MKNKKEKRQIGRKYNNISSIFWALDRLWKLEKKYLCFIFAVVPVTVVLPLVQSYFSKVLLPQ